MPSTRSTTIPNITRVYILKNMWKKPSCINICVTGCHQRKSVANGNAIANVPFINTGFMSVATNIIT